MSELEKEFDAVKEEQRFKMHSLLEDSKAKLEQACEIADQYELSFAVKHCDKIVSYLGKNLNKKSVAEINPIPQKEEDWDYSNEEDWESSNYC